MSDTLRQALTETVSAAIIRIDDEEDTGRINRASARLYARTAIDVVLADPTVARWKAAQADANRLADMLRSLDQRLFIASTNSKINDTLYWHDNPDAAGQTR